MVGRKAQGTEGFETEAMDLKRKQMDLDWRQMLWKGKGKSYWLSNTSRTKFEIAQLEKEITMTKALKEEQLKENEETKTIITSTMDNWIQNQG